MEQTQSPRKRFSFISDPSHGWLLVTPAELRTVGIAESDITPYSYRDLSGELIALEEDCDAHTFLRKWEAMIGEPVEIEDAVGGLKFIRDWPRFGTKACEAAGQGGVQ
ncbi:hypothetical protein [Loktanella sp. S4079]|uniref:hypothetical protein n=1 Tax=Loktanella sp. S4079 TaxID=579483 RepID=UPI0005FA8EB6|nr:hypothetical protein [Loktanella sp. S4079]KJZ17914.1 hypothetical protein TW80_16370 [Loktanella sp. S4079]